MARSVAAARIIAKSARSKVRAGRAVRAAVVAAALFSEVAAEVAEQESAPPLFQAKARDAKRPMRDANPRNPAGNIVYSPFLAPRISWQPPTKLHETIPCGLFLVILKLLFAHLFYAFARNHQNGQSTRQIQYSKSVKRNMPNVPTSTCTSKAR
ncbi:hypothetical protein HMPREF1583_00593 [Gardnerella vaginalis JCP8151B]|nr:hypothetical protein HMPREF1583_00593 [Gardnerella vaginalis JCP8151B]